MGREKGNSSGKILWQGSDDGSPLGGHGCNFDTY